MVGHAFVVNYTLTHKDKINGEVSDVLTHGEFSFIAYVPGELVFFKSAPTIISARVAKVEGNLVAGIFLDYYMGPDGKFSGQCICVCLVRTSSGRISIGESNVNISSCVSIALRSYDVRTL